MSYEPTNWKSGDTVTSAKLNKMEQGIADGGAFLVGLTINETIISCDKTAGEIWTAFTGGRTIVFVIPNTTAYTILLAETEPGYNFTVWNGEGTLTFTAASADSYPSAELD